MKKLKGERSNNGTRIEKEKIDKISFQESNNHGEVMMCPGVRGGEEGSGEEVREKRTPKQYRSLEGSKSFYQSDESIG